MYFLLNMGKFHCYVRVPKGKFILFSSPKGAIFYFPDCEKRQSPFTKMLKIMLKGMRAAPFSPSQDAIVANESVYKGVPATTKSVFIHPGVDCCWEASQIILPSLKIQE